MKRLFQAFFALWIAFVIWGFNATVNSETIIYNPKCELIYLTPGEIDYYESKPEIFGTGMVFKKLCGEDLDTYCESQNQIK